MKVIAHGVPQHDFNCGDTLVLDGSVVMLVRDRVGSYSYLYLETGEVETSCGCKSPSAVVALLRVEGHILERTYNVELLWEPNR
jgi:hypothetical protein